MERTEYHRIIRLHLATAYLLSEEKIDSVLPGFLKSLQQLMFGLEQAAVTGNDETVTRTGHAIKGALLNLGLSDLAEKAFTIEKNAGSQKTGRERSRCIAELNAEIAKII